MLAWEGSGRGVYVAYCEIQIDHDGVPLKDLKGLSLYTLAARSRFKNALVLSRLAWNMVQRAN